jgi:hypothetical protein
MSTPTKVTAAAASRRRGSKWRQAGLVATLRGAGGALTWAGAVLVVRAISRLP